MNTKRHSVTPKAKSDARLAGERMKVAIHVERERVGITSDSELAVRSGVHYDTFMNWFSGKTTPRPFEVRKVADVLQVPYGDLLAAYEGRQPAAVPLEQAVAELIVEIRAAVVDERRARAEMMRAIAATLSASISVPVATMDVPAPTRTPVANGK
jgi:transcriptional regulator with XRE-family HTH domain